MGHCDEQSRLNQAVIDAADKVYGAESALEAAKGKTVDLIPYMAFLQAAKAEEQLAIAALDEHHIEHGCLLIAGSNPAISSADYEGIRANAQQALIGFLGATLKAGMTVAQSALLVKNQGRTDHFIEAKRNAVKADESVKKFVSLVKDVDTRTEIQNRLSDLERLISAL
jgi:hypothetical protein